MITRRTINKMMLAVAGLSTSSSRLFAADLISQTKHQSTVKLPAIGMGTWITFDVNPANNNLNNHIALLDAFFAGGGQMIDSSPMYGFAQQVLGLTLPDVIGNNRLFSATKVWTMGQQNGILQMQESMKLWGLEQLDLMYIHNMLDWKSHLPTLNQWKAAGLIKHTGITTSHGRRHQDLIEMLKKNPVDFVQLSYNINNREAERYLLPLAQDLGIQVVINRPFQGGGLFSRVRNQPLPDWSQEIQCDHWAQFFLKFVISHPAITCAIPATSQVSHMQQNMQAMKGDLPDQAMRLEMIKYFQSVT